MAFFCLRVAGLAAMVGGLEATANTGLDADVKKAPEIRARLDDGPMM